MPQPTVTKPPPGVGTTLIRLADIPLEQRLTALQQIIGHDNISFDEALDLLNAAIDPGDASGRIAA